MIVAMLFYGFIIWAVLVSTTKGEFICCHWLGQLVIVAFLAWLFCTAMVCTAAGAVRMEVYCNGAYALIAYTTVAIAWRVAYKLGYAKDTTSWLRMWLFSPLTFPVCAMPLVGESVRCLR